MQKKKKTRELRETIRARENGYRLLWQILKLFNASRI